MMRHIKLLILIAVIILMPVGCQHYFAMRKDGLSAKLLRCEYRTDPLGIDILAPRLSWVLESKQRGQKQTAYQVLVASDRQQLESDCADMWDSEKVQSSETTAIVYAGKPLTSDTVCYWKVRVWDKNGNPSRWSRPAKWSMGLLRPEDWQAEWIGYDVDEKVPPLPDVVKRSQWIWSRQNANQSAPVEEIYFRRTFKLPQDLNIKKAVCYITADNIFHLYLNGQIIRSVRNYNIIYEASLADYLKPGKNVITVIAANEGQTPNPAGLLSAVRIESEDGQVLELPSDKQWLTNTMSEPDWQNADFNDTSWSEAVELGPLGMEPWRQTGMNQLVLPQARYFRKTFAAHDKKIKRAHLYTTALGIYQLFVNGWRITEDYLSPGWTDYRKRVYYRTYDVTDRLQNGDNAIGAILADGWYAGYVGGGQTRNHYGRKTRLLSQLNIEYEDGTTQVIATGSDWKASTGPILHADLLQGETYDARKEMPGWHSPGFDDAAWRPVIVGDTEVDPIVQAAVSEPVIVFETVKPVSVTEPVRGKYVFNMGQNFAGVVRLHVKGREGQRIQLRHGERLNPNGTIYTTNLRTADATDVYICKGGKEEVWQPHFTFHGFQYVEVSGLNHKPKQDMLTGLALSSDTPLTGTFECSNSMVNKLQSNAVWTQRMNFIDIPTDCPQRDERLGWTGDVQVYVNTACYQNDVQAFFTKWLTDLTDAQRGDGQFPRYAPLRVKDTDGGPAWADAGVICPWTIYKMYGDARILRTHYDAMKSFIAFCENRCTDELLPPEQFHCFGDWLNINDDTPHDVIFMAYFGYSTKLLANIADALDKPEDAAMYNELFERIKDSFNKAYVESDGKIKGDTQTAYVLAIAYDLLDEQQQKQAAEHLIRRIEECNSHLSTGFVGTKDLMLALAKIKRNDVAYGLLYNDTFPSWGFTIKHGATSIWERWNGWTPAEGFADPGMNSFAHYSFGAVCQWIFENIGGIKTDDPGFRTIIIHPQPDDKLTWAKTSYRSIRGSIVSNWEIRSGRFVLDVTIPPNTTATVFVPARDAETVLESGEKAQNADGVKLLKLQDNFIAYEVVSGQYRFISPWPR